MNTSLSRSTIKYCGNCSIPIENCVFNDKKTYKQCLQSLAKHYPHESEQVLSTTTAPAISISKCGIARINGIYKQQSKSRPFTYIHHSQPALSSIRADITELSLHKVWIISEQSSVLHSTFIIHHYINRTISLHPPTNRWQCIAGIYPLPSIKHIDLTRSNKVRKSPTIQLTIEHQKANERMSKHWRSYPKMPNLMETLFIKQLN
eukprot:413085_1